MTNRKISVIVPCYNEEKVLYKFYDKLKEVLDEIKLDYEIILVDDGSHDKTFEVQKDLKQKDSKIRIISFSRNFGKEAALYAGLENSTGDLVVVIDADLQHNPSIIKEMLKGIDEGYDVVATRRIDRKGEEKVKSMLSGAFYKVCGRFMEVKLKDGEQDYRMMKRKVVDAILSLKEYNRFSKGIFNWVGFNVKTIDVENAKRLDGTSKWNLRSLFSYAIDGITSFTVAPLKLSIILGVIIALVSGILGVQIVIQTIIYGKDVPGYASTIVAVLFIGGIELLSIGILSEYVSKMYLEIKNRPKYIVKYKID
jgi:glycosyltransferase involved in cell wall biosynthesis